MLVFRDYEPPFPEECTLTGRDEALYLLPPPEMRRVQPPAMPPPPFPPLAPLPRPFRAYDFSPAPFISDAARQHIIEILTRAAAMQYKAAAGITGVPQNTTAKAVALAQPAVTGSTRWREFSQEPPQDSTIVASTRNRLLAELSIPPADRLLQSSVATVLDAAYTAAWALRGSKSVREMLRPTLGWIAVCAEADSPHRPVNVPSAPYPQFDMEITGFRGYMRCRYMIASREADVGAAFPGRGTRQLPPDEQPSIPDGARVVLFIHGHGSRLEECLSLVPWIHDIGANNEENFVVVAMDLPGRGYSSMHAHESFGVPDAFNERIPTWPENRRYPILEMYEQFLGEFLARLSERIGRRLANLTIVGGSLGGNLCMRLANRFGVASMPAEHRRFFREAVYVAWSPASVWHSFVRGHDHFKNETLRHLRDRMRRTPPDANPDDVRQDFFSKIYYEAAAGPGLDGLPPYSSSAGMWYRGGDWERCKKIMIEQGSYETLEVYSELYRSWHWRVALEQLIYSHHDRRAGTARGPASYTEIDRPLTLLAGEHDDYRYADIHGATRDIAEQLPDLPGAGVFLKHTGHSIHAERPQYLSTQIVHFTLDPS